MPKSNDNHHLTGRYDPHASGHVIVEVHDADKRPEGVKPGLIGAPAVVVTHPLVQDYPDGIPTDLPLTVVSVYGGLDEAPNAVAYLMQVAADLYHGSLAVIDAMRMLAERDQ